MNTTLNVEQWTSSDLPGVTSNCVHKGWSERPSVLSEARVAVIFEVYVADTCVISSQCFFLYEFLVSVSQHFLK